MNLLEISLIGIGLAMDAFAVSVCKGLSIKKLKLIFAFAIAICFGFFQSLMPLIGYYLGNTFQSIIISISHWLTFLLLTLIGINMIKDSINQENNSNLEEFTIGNTLLLGIATSLDALAVGITFSLFQTNIFLVITIIGIITFVLCFCGVWIGNHFGNKLQAKAEITGGIILIGIGIKILMEHFGFFF